MNASLPNRLDVLVVGGGPAGLSAGIVMAQQGLRVLVCERERFPVDKVCGEGILPETLRCLTELGVRPHLADVDHHVVQGIRFRSPRGYVASARFAEGPGMGTTRLALSTALARRARDVPNLSILDGTTVELGRVGRDGVEVGVAGRAMTTRLVVGADGLRSGVRRWACLDGAPTRLRRLGARQHFACEPWSDHVEVTAGDGVEAYVTPCGARAVNVAFLWDPSRVSTAGGRELFGSLLRSFPELSQRLRGARPLDKAQGTGPLRRRATSVVADGTVLVGDASGYVDACTGEGLGQALSQSLSLARTVAPCLRATEGVPSRRQLSPYARAHAAIARPYVHATQLMLFAQRGRRRSDWFTRLAADVPAAMTLFVSYAMGVRPARDALPLVPAILASVARQSLPSGSAGAERRTIHDDPRT